MACPDCRAVIHAADTLNVAQLITQARRAQGGRAAPLAFCGPCVDGTRGADAPFGLTPAELCADFAADAPGGGDVQFLLVFNPSDGSISYAVNQGAASTSGRLAAGVDPSTAQQTIASAAQSAGLTLPPSLIFQLPSATTPSVSGTVNAKTGQPAGPFGQGLLNKSEAQFHRLMIELGVVLVVVVLGVVLFYKARPRR